MAEMDAEAILHSHHEKLLAALTSYLEKHPDAEDRSYARNHAIDTAAWLDKKELAVSLMRQEIDQMLLEEIIDIELISSFAVNSARYASRYGMKDEVKAIYETLNQDPEVGQSPLFINAANRMMQMLKIPGIGDQPALTGVTTVGDELILADLKGKVVLLDFWATWCPPCMAELPTMKATYEKYHQKGFEIVGISADRTREALTGVIEKEGLSWPNMYDKEQQASLVDEFGIQGFPTMLLLDQTGTVVAVNPRGEELEKTVAMLLGDTQN